MPKLSLRSLKDLKRMMLRRIRKLRLLRKSKSKRKLLLPKRRSILPWLSSKRSRLKRRPKMLRMKQLVNNARRKQIRHKLMLNNP